MSGLLDMNGPFLDAVRKFADIVLYNALFVICSLPVFTIGASLTALCEGMQRIAADEESDRSVAKEFFATFRRCFLKSTGLWLLCILGGLFLYSLQNAVLVLSGSSDGSGIGSSYAITYYVTFFFLAFGYQNLFPTRARWQELPVVGTVVRAYQLAMISFPWTLLGLLLTYLFIYVTIFMNNNVMRFGIFVWVACGFGVVTYLSSFCFLKGAKKFEDQLAEAKAAAEEGRELLKKDGNMFTDIVEKMGSNVEKNRERAAAEKKDDK